MTDRKRNRGSAGNGDPIPQRVEDAARNMMSQTAGPRRGYIPANPGNMRNGNEGYYPGQVPVNGYYARDSRQNFYSGQQPLNGGQRGYITPAVTAKQSGPKKKHTVLLALVLLILAAALGTGGYFAVTHQLRTKEINDKVEPYNSLFCPGVYVDGINLEGMTPQQALNSVDSQIQQRHDAWKVQLTYNGNPVMEINADMMGFSVDSQSVLIQAWQRGHTGDNEQRYEDMLLLEESPCILYTAQPDGNTNVIDEKLSQIKAYVDKPAVDAEMIGFDPTLDYPFQFRDEEYGWYLDIEPLKTKLYQMVSTMESGSVEITPEKLEPAVSKETLMRTKYTRRAYASTEISRHSEENRNNNIRVAFDYINSNGFRIQPNETFSFNKVVGKRTPERGFYPATEYVYGEHVEGYGGGVCQVSTTLYQAAVRAGLQILERKPHSDSVSYAEYGKDATVYWSEYKGGKNIDFSFRNNTDEPIFIVGSVVPNPKNKKRLIAQVTIYGADMGGITYDIDTVEEIIPCTLAPVATGDKEQVAKAKDGVNVDSYRVEYTNGYETNRVKLYRDEYKPRAERYYDPSLSKN